MEGVSDLAPSGFAASGGGDRWMTSLVPVGLVDAVSVASLLAIDERRWWVWLVSQLPVAPLLVRRRAPVGVFCVVCAVALAQWFLDLRLVADLALLVALFTVASELDRKRTIVSAAVLEVGAVMASLRFAPGGQGVLGSLVFLSGLVVAATFVGVTMRTREAYLAGLEERAAQLQRESAQQAFSSRRPKSGLASPGRCTTSWPTTWRS